ncbi:alpha/beta fold hydrolase [Terrimonas alba]|uniref:alpha/beta fold hydrolase n=1 Tax=Terrimonas alba TaxID=3349636 RepID=UPI0035F2B50B
MRCFLLFILLSNQSFCQSPIDKTEIITIGGIKQYIRMKGKDSSKPLLLFLHGGPGSSVLSKADHMTGKLQQQFVVVHWDQRETGETLRLNKSSRPLTLRLFYDDTHDLIDSLLRRFQLPKLYLAGYSWGSGLGFYIADKYPELLYAYIAISPVINTWESEKIALELLKERMGRKAQKELTQVKIPFENAEQLYYHRKWLFRFDGQKFVSLTLPKSFVLAWGVVWFNVWSESCAINLFESLPAINCPVYFFAGEKDYQTNHSITQEYFNKVSAPKKDLFLFADAGHGLPETDPGLFQDIIIDKILPETYNP